MRLLAIEAAAGQGAPLGVMTCCYSEPHDRATFEQLEAIVQRNGGEMLPVFLSCSEAELGRRIGNADRAARGKVTTMRGLEKFRQDNGLNMVAVRHANCLRVDTEALPAEAAATEIVRHFCLA